MSAPKYRPYDKVKEKLAKALQGIATGEHWPGDIRSIADVIRATRHSNREVRRTAIWLLGQLHYNRADKALVRVLHDDPDIFERGSAADWLGHLTTERALTALLDALQNDQHVEVGERAASGLRFMSQDERITNALIAVMANKAEESIVREMVADAICGQDAQKAGPVLVESLSDPSPNVRYWSANALAMSRYAPAIEVLNRLAHEDTSICFEPDTQSETYPNGLVNGSVCVSAAEAMISIKRNLKISLSRKEREYRHRVK